MAPGISCYCYLLCSAIKYDPKCKLKNISFQTLSENRELAYPTWQRWQEHPRLTVELKCTEHRTRRARQYSNTGIRQTASRRATTVSETCIPMAERDIARTLDSEESSALHPREWGRTNTFGECFISNQGLDVKSARSPRKGPQRRHELEVFLFLEAGLVLRRCRLLFVDTCIRP